MGSHTWCYVSLPEKQKDWRLDIVKSIKHAKSDIEKTLQNTESLKDISKTYQDTYIFNRERLIKQLEVTTNQKERENLLEKLKSYEKDIKEWDFENMIKLHENKLSEITKFLSSYNQSFIDDPQKFFGWLKDAPESLEDTIQMTDGIYIIRDNKIYRENRFGVKLKYELIGDSDFRIFNYEAKPCYTAQDCFDRCSEEDVQLSGETIKRILDWFKEYPDTIIEIG